MEEESIINWKLFDDLLKDFPDEFQGILCDFLHELTPRLDTMRQCSDAGDYKAVAIDAHRLKGVIGNLGFHGLWSLMGSVETLSEQGEAAFPDSKLTEVRLLLDRSLDVISKDHPELVKGLK
jgi:HPt (histidine-containing phosphotransfer) domain-containing protein